MHATPEETAAEYHSADPFSEQSVNELSSVCLAAACAAWETPRAFDLIQRLWGNDAVVDAVEVLRDAHEGAGNLEAARARLIAAIESEIRWPVVAC